jgi:urea carboxylase
MQIRQDFPHGRYLLSIEQMSFSLAEFQTLAGEQEHQIGAFQAQREQAFADELT